LSKRQTIPARKKEKRIKKIRETPGVRKVTAVTGSSGLKSAV